MKYQRKVTETVEAITFDELVAIGHADPGANIVDGVPWSFFYGDTHVSHESDNCYVVGGENFERGQMLVTPEVRGAVPVAWWPEEFDTEYEAIPTGDELGQWLEVVKRETGTQSEP